MKNLEKYRERINALKGKPIDWVYNGHHLEAFVAGADADKGITVKLLGPELEKAPEITRRYPEGSENYLCVFVLDFSKPHHRVDIEHDLAMLEGGVIDWEAESERERAGRRGVMARCAFA